MSKSFNVEQPFGGRQEYQKLPIDDLVAECENVTNTIDDVLDAPQESDGTYADTYNLSSDGLTQFRSFTYLNGNHASLQSWPLIEKTLEIQYTRAQGGATEHYYIAIGTRVHQLAVSQDPVFNIYQISYSKYRATVETSIQEPDIMASEDTIGNEDLSYEMRAATTYDHNSLLAELGHLQTRLHAEAQEAVHLQS